MGRFVSGKYSAGLPEGAMLAYVMDGNVTAAATDVGSFCEKKKRISLGAINKPVVDAHPDIPPPSGRSKHTRDAAHGGLIMLHHLFVAV